MKTSLTIIANMIDGLPKGASVLEPSAGVGDIVKHLLYKQCIVDCIELNTDNFSTLRRQYGKKANTIHGDFMKYPFEKEKYDYIVAVPPYSNNQDCEHIMHMYQIVRTGGKVISLTLPYWVTGIHDNQAKFRQWLYDKTYTIKIFNNDESYVSCPKMLLTIQK